MRLNEILQAIHGEYKVMCSGKEVTVKPPGV